MPKPSQPPKADQSVKSFSRNVILRGLILFVIMAGIILLFDPPKPWARFPYITTCFPGGSGSLMEKIRSNPTT
jgi:hypothetical protein